MMTFKKSSSSLKQVSCEENQHQVVRSLISLSLEQSSSLLDSIGKHQSESGSIQRQHRTAILDGLSTPQSKSPTSSMLLLHQAVQSKTVQLQDSNNIVVEKVPKSPFKTRRLSVSVINLDPIQPDQHFNEQYRRREEEYRRGQQRVVGEFSGEIINRFRMRTLERVSSSSMLLRANQRIGFPTSSPPQKFQIGHTINSIGNNDKTNDTTIEKGLELPPIDFFLDKNTTTTSNTTTILGAHRKFSQILRGSLRGAYQSKQHRLLKAAPRRKTFEELHSNSDDHRFIVNVPKFGSSGRLLIGNNLPTNQASNSQMMRTMLQFRLARMSFYLILLWLISWTPIAFLVMINSVFTCYQASAIGVFTANTMTKLGPAFDVFIYGVSHPRIKSKFRKIIKRLFNIKTCMGKFNNDLSI